MRHLSYILLLSCLCCLSCRKDREVADYVGEYEISGSVLEAITYKPIAYAVVGVLVQRKGQTSSLGTQDEIVGRTDENGRFSLKFVVKQEEYRYYLNARSIGYFDKGTAGDLIIFTKNGKREQDVILYPQSYISCRIKGNKGGYKVDINRFHGTFYQGVDTVRTRPVYPTRKSNIVYWVKFADPSLNYEKKLELPALYPHDTAFFTVEF